MVQYGSILSARIEYRFDFVLFLFIFYSIEGRRNKNQLKSETTPHHTNQHTEKMTIMTTPFKIIQHKNNGLLQQQEVKTEPIISFYKKRRQDDEEE